MVSRLLGKPVSVVVKGPSAGGKSFTVETVLKLFPESAYLDFTSMSEHALIYDERPISHRYIVLYEAASLGADKPGEVNTLAYCVRSLLSEGCIKYMTVEKTADGMQPRLIERPGPTGLITTTTWASLHPENETRLLSLTVKDDPAHTRCVFEALANRVNGQGPAEPDLAPWHALQTWLELAGERRVSIPYAHDLAAKASPRAVRLRRDFWQVLALIQAHAILHQESRKRDEQGRIVATLEDYRAVYDLVVDILSEGVEATVSATIRETVQAVAELSRQHDRPVKVTEVAMRLGLDKSAASRRVRVGLEHGYLTNMEDKRGKPAQLAIGEPLPDEEPILPKPEELERLHGCTIQGGCEDSLLAQTPGKEKESVLNPPGTRATVQPVQPAEGPEPVVRIEPKRMVVDRGRLQELIDSGVPYAEALDLARVIEPEPVPVAGMGDCLICGTLTRLRVGDEFMCSTCQEQRAAVPQEMTA